MNKWKSIWLMNLLFLNLLRKLIDQLIDLHMIIYFLTYNKEKVGTSLLSQVILVSLRKQDFLPALFMHLCLFTKREGDF